MKCFINRTGSFLPGPVIDNDSISDYLGEIEGEDAVREKVLVLNGIEGRHYAQNQRQIPTCDVYGLATEAARNCIKATDPISLLACGTTYAPLAAPGVASLVHSRLQASGLLDHSLEISSHGGICTSSSAALIGAIRAVDGGSHQTALCIGAEHASEVLKSSKIKPIDDRSQHETLRHSQWYMAIFLRFMLSDGAGAFLLQGQPNDSGHSLQVNWVHSKSYAHCAPLCMKLDNANALLTQDVNVLSKHLVQFAEMFLIDAMRSHDDDLDAYTMVLPHMSSFFFRRKMQRVMAAHSTREEVPFWSNLATAGNSGAASIYVMLDQYLRVETVSKGDRLLLFVPESGQFNFVMISLTVVS